MKTSTVKNRSMASAVALVSAAIFSIAGIAHAQLRQVACTGKVLPGGAQSLPVKVVPRARHPVKVYAFKEVPKGRNGSGTG